jgi:hypothetical protein
MLSPKLDPLPGPVADLQDRINHWRTTRPHREPMPEDLWLKSARFARQHGIYAISKALKLNYEALKGRVVQGPPKRRARPTSTSRPAFVQLDPMPAIPSDLSSTVEIEGVRGGKLTIRLSGPTTLDAAAIVDAFLRGRR